MAEILPQPVALVISMHAQRNWLVRGRESPRSLVDILRWTEIVGGIGLKKLGMRSYLAGGNGAKGRRLRRCGPSTNAVRRTNSCHLSFSPMPMSVASVIAIRFSSSTFELIGRGSFRRLFC